MKLYIILIILLINKCACEGIEVQLEQGTLLGSVEKSFFKEQKYYAFKGIPYAETPIGSLRFQPPLPHRGWNGTYEALDDKPTCFQFSSRMRNDEPFGISGSEDCLYLSVFTPDTDGYFPVIVFDFNDNFRTGYNGTKTYSPDFFIEENVIIVTIQHRLHIFGYINTQDKVIPPNSGLKDFVLGLTWIQENIQKFGGDPSRVTLMGNNGGAIIANILLYSEKASGLFSAVIMQSGTAMETSVFPTGTRDVAFKLGAILDIKTNDSKILLDGLQKVDAETLVTKEGEAVDNNFIDKLQMSVFPFSPVVESGEINEFLKALPEKSNIVNDVPILIGMNSREGLDLASHYIFEPKLIEQLAQDFLFLFPIRPNFRFNRESEIYEDAIKEILNFYFEEGYFYYGNILEYAVYLGDILKNYALDFTAKHLAAKIESPIFYYMFDYRGLLNENSEYMARRARFSMKNWGATIGDELCYLQFCTRIKRKYIELKNLVTQQPEIKVLKRMVRLFANFSKTRNPTPLEDDNILKNFKWQPISKGSDKTEYLHITKNLQMKTDPLGERAEFWNNFLSKYSNKSVDGIVTQFNHTRDEL